MSPDDPTRGEQQTPEEEKAKTQPEEAGGGARKRLDTQPLFLQEYWQRVTPPAPLPSVPSVDEDPKPGEERPSSAELPALEELLEYERERERQSASEVSAIESLAQLEAGFPSLPEGRMPDLRVDELPDGLADVSGEITAVSTSTPVQPLSLPDVEDDEADAEEPEEPTMCNANAAIELSETQVAHLDKHVPKAGGTPDLEDDMDVVSTRRFKKLVLPEEGATSVWDFAGSAIQRPDDEDGQIIADRYRIVEDLAAGGMARIYRVRHLNLGKEFALKIIHSEMSSDRNMQKIFIREARVTSLMNHPNIVQVTDFGVDPEIGSYIVMEYLKGETLHERLSREGRLRLPLALDIGLQVAEALHYMHQQNIIHCDIKPENIFLCRTPREMRRGTIVKLIDFGLSRRKVMGAQLASSEVGGTPDFMAPEQIKGNAPQPSMDIYGLGCILYEMIVGEVPFQGERIEDVIAAQLHEKPAPPSSRLDEPLDETVDALIMKALEKDPDHRQPSMGQVIFEMRTVMDMLGVRSSRRRRGAGPRGGATSAAPEAIEIPRRLEEASLVFDHCPVPLFRIDTEPKIIVANRAFCQFVGLQSVEEAEGMPLDRTRLGLLYPNLRTDVLQCALSKTTLQKGLAFEKDADRTVAVMFWLVPEFDPSVGRTTFSGIILPSVRI